MKCPYCNTELKENTTFCDSCGKEIELISKTVELNTGAVEEKNNSSFDSAKKKKIMVVATAIIAIIIAAFIFKSAVYPALTYNSAIKARNSEEYKVAIDKFSKIPEYKDVNKLIDETYFDYGKQLIEEEKYDEALDALNNTTNPDKPKYQSYATALKSFAEKNYNDTINRLVKLGDFENSLEILNKAYYEKAENSFSKKDYDDAKTCYKKTTGYKNIEEKIQLCDFMIAENDVATGNYEAALKIYKSFPKDAIINNKKVSDQIDICIFLQAEKEYADGNYLSALKKYKQIPKQLQINGITAKKRIDTINKYKDILKFSGTWVGSKGENSVRQTHNSTGIWEQWDSTYVDTMDVKITLNDDGTFNMEGTAQYYTYTNYSSISTGLNGMFVPVKFSKKNIKKIPETIEKSGAAKLTFDGSKFHLNFDYTDSNYSMHFTYHYTSSITYKKK